MYPKTIELLAGILFLLIAIVGGGFVIKEIQIPRVPKWPRIISGFLGLIFCILYLRGVSTSLTLRHAPRVVTAPTG